MSHPDNGNGSPDFLKDIFTTDDEGEFASEDPDHAA